MSRTSEKLSEIVANFPKYFATDEIKIACNDKKKFQVVEKVKAYAKSMNYPINDIDGVRITYTNGWALVRASNTGPNIIFRAEADTLEGVKILENIYVSMIKKEMANIESL